MSKTKPNKDYLFRCSAAEKSYFPNLFTLFDSHRCHWVLILSKILFGSYNSTRQNILGSSCPRK